MKSIYHCLFGDKGKGPSLTLLPPLHNAGKIYPSTVILGAMLFLPSPHFSTDRSRSHTDSSFLRLLLESASENNLFLSTSAEGSTKSSGWWFQGAGSPYHSFQVISHKAGAQGEHWSFSRDIIWWESTVYASQCHLSIYGQNWGRAIELHYKLVSTLCSKLNLS